MRTAEVKRRTTETNISLCLSLDGSGTTDIQSGCSFLDHMLTLFVRHGQFDLTLRCDGDTQVDYHHSTEDIGICLGMAFQKALGTAAGINRYGDMLLPMDEALVLTAVDISGRGVCCYDMSVPAEKVGNFDTELGKEFWLAFARSSGITIHFRKLAGDNSHHILEASFKSAARSLRKAVAVDPALAGQVPSTKGVLI